MIRTPELDLWPLLPELFLAGFGIIGMLFEAFSKRSPRPVHLAIALAGLLAATAATLALWEYGGAATVLAGTIANDRFAVVARLILLGVAFLGLLLGTHYFDRDPDGYRGEFYPLVLFATSGMTLITVAADLIVVFLALEILSLALYVLTGITGHRHANEGAMKYFLLGAFSSSFFLYGIAMAYGATGTTKIADIANALAGTTDGHPLALVATVMLLIGFGFKVSAAPFHMWTPDVYQGAPTPVTAFMSAATKVAAFMALLRVLSVALQPMEWDWTPIVAALAAVSVIVGSVLAIAQTDVKRMLAYSSVAHAGFILTGITATGAAGIRSATFYLIAYAAMTIGAFGVVMMVSFRGEERTSLASYRGLHRTDPVAAGLMALFLISLAGLPPTGGFIAKVGVFGAAIDGGYWWLSLIGVLASVAAAYFYLRVIVLMYMQDDDDVTDAVVTTDGSLLPRIAVVIPAALILLLGVFPGVISDFLDAASVLRW
ncbi:MAG TPA: NADH-quinone oxidoreductase subunit N [Actinomycetota bacterium]|nr:NADH-quinone oxidoreductase subunit N [Actinomycetota bacterium]